MKTTFYEYYLKKTKFLYAYTDNKSFAKKFEEQRNMDLFIKKKYSFSEDDEDALVFQMRDKYNLNRLEETILNDGNRDFVIISTLEEDSILSVYCDNIESSVRILKASLTSDSLYTKKLIDIVNDASDISHYEESGDNIVDGILDVDTFKLFYNIFKDTFLDCPSLIELESKKNKFDL